MKLSGNVSIVFENKVITDHVLAMYRKKWKGYAIIPGVNDSSRSDEEILHALLFETTPLMIIGDESADPLILEASLKIFPYSINGNQEFASFGLRFMPKQGIVKSVELDDDWKIAINAFSMSSERFSINLANGCLHMEVFFKPTKQQEEILPPIGFHEKVVLP